MLLKKSKPISNSLRHKIRICKNDLLKSNRLIKHLNKYIKRKIAQEQLPANSRPSPARVFAGSTAVTRGSGNGKNAI